MHPKHPEHLGAKTVFPSSIRRLLPFLTASAFILPAFGSAAAEQSPSVRVDAILKRAMEDRHIPGLQAAVVASGNIVFSRSYGLANLQTPVPVDANIIFTLNSITKAFTGVAAMLEVEKGRLDLSAPISRYLDDIPAAWGQVTVRQLFGQVSGLPDILAYGDSKLTGLEDEKGAWAWALKQPVMSPGSKEDYCQTNLALVQRIINRLNKGSPDGSVIGNEISSAGMVSTFFGDSRDVIKTSRSHIATSTQKGRCEISSSNSVRCSTPDPVSTAQRATWRGG